VRRLHNLRPWALSALPLLVACASAPRGVPSHYGQSTDSATSTCLRNPACYTVPAGEEATLPWATRTADAIRTAGAALRLLEAAEVARVEEILVECAEQAELTVNERHFGPGGQPGDRECREVLGKDAKGRPVTRAARLGDEKHKEVARCVQSKLGESIPGNFSWEPTYLKDWKTGELRWISPQQVAQWLSEGLEALLLGTLVPDLVLHANDNPLKVQRVYDFKFPCPRDRRRPPVWTKYPPESPYAGQTQGKLYQNIFGGEKEPAMVAPGHGVKYE
jgi:hypothetical protein